MRDVIACPWPWYLPLAPKSMATTINYIPVILQDVIICTFPWYMLLAYKPRAVTINYILPILWDMITCPSHRYLPLANKLRGGTNYYFRQIPRDVITCYYPWYLLLVYGSSCNTPTTGEDVPYNTGKINRYLATTKPQQNANSLYFSTPEVHPPPSIDMNHPCIITC